MAGVRAQTAVHAGVYVDLDPALVQGQHLVDRLLDPLFGELRDVVVDSRILDRRPLEHLHGYRPLFRCYQSLAFRTAPNSQPMYARVKMK